MLDRFLSHAEHRRATLFHRTADARLFRFAHGFLRLILARYTGTLDPGAISLANDARGKPRLARASGCRPVEFNLSHSGDAVLVALTRTRHVGVDVETLDRAPDAEAIARRFFAAPELARILASPPAQRAGLFLRHWVMKEAFVKGLGLGLGAIDLKAFAMDPDATNGRIHPLTREMHRHSKTWAVAEVAAPEGHVAAVAVNTPVLRWKGFAWQGPI